MRPGSRSDYLTLPSALEIVQGKGSIKITLAVNLQPFWRSPQFGEDLCSIGYCATAVRFDISHAVSVLSRHLARPCVI